MIRLFRVFVQASLKFSDGQLKPARNSMDSLCHHCLLLQNLHLTDFLLFELISLGVNFEVYSPRMDELKAWSSSVYLNRK